MPRRLDHEKIARALQYPTDAVIDVIIDTDAYAEVDDQAAIAWALCSPDRLNVVAVHAAPYQPDAYLRRLLPPGMHLDAAAFGGHAAASAAEGMEMSFEEIEHIFALLDIPAEGKAFRGAAHYMDETGGAPVDSDAARNLIRTAMAMPEGKRLYVLSIAAITNVASAILLEPAVRDRIVVVWLGGHAPFFKDAGEFNLASDLSASRVILDSGVPLVLLPCSGVVDRLTVSREEIEARLIGKGKTADYLGQIIRNGINTSPEYLAMMTAMGGLSGGLNDIPKDVRSRFPVLHSAGTRVVWDIAAVGYVLNPNWVTSSLTPAPILNDDLTWSRDDARHPIRLCYNISRNYIFGDFFAKLNGK